MEYDKTGYDNIWKATARKINTSQEHVGIWKTKLDKARQDTMKQYNTIHDNKRQYNTTQHKTIQLQTIQARPTQHISRYGTTRRDNTIQYKIIQNRSRRTNPIQDKPLTQYNMIHYKTKSDKAKQ